MNFQITTFWIGITVILLLVGCDSSDQENAINSVIENTKVHFVPDSRVDRFEINLSSQHNSSIVLKGETTIRKSKAALLDSLSKRNISIVDSIVVLPAVEKVYALVNNSVGNIRSEPGHASQLLTQALLGMPLKVLKKDGGWYFVQTPDDYLGWIDAGGFKHINESKYSDWVNGKKIIYTNTYGFSYKNPSLTSEKITDLVAGNILKFKSRSGSFYRVVYPDNREAYVPIGEAELFRQWEKNTNVSKESLVKTAKTMMGAPYLWGGTSTKGIDCSGFTKTIYFMNGRVIPRDASQQVKAGKLVDAKKDFSKLEVGDLLFFGREASQNRSRRVSHVGMWIGNREFIHSAGRVHISSVDSTAENFDPGNLNRYLEARRYLDDWEGNIIQTSEMYSLGRMPEKSN